MTFKVGDRVEHVDIDHKGTVDRDDGEYVAVRWDDGKTGNLKYDKSVWFNAFRLQKLVSKSVA